MSSSSAKRENNAYTQLMEELREGETVEAIVFGAWGWGCEPQDGGGWRLGYGEPTVDAMLQDTVWDDSIDDAVIHSTVLEDTPRLPFEKRGVILSLDEAREYMSWWSFYGGHGAPTCYATYIWTNQRVLWVTQYDGSTRLNSAPRNPVGCFPDMPGG